ncbi:MAG: aspartate aminotransferase family protein [Acidobacteriota bacterium]
MLCLPPGPRSRHASERLRIAEAPGINTLYGGAPNIVWAEARGANVLDVDGNRYVDLTAGFGVAAVGHRHPRIVEAVTRQAEYLLHGLGDAAGHEVRIELAERLIALAPMPRAQVYFAVSGADAVEIALKTALLARPGRSRIVAFEPAYHGLTLGALAASSRRAFRRPFAAHLHDAVLRMPFGHEDEEFETALLAALETGDVAAVLVEPIVGREGVLVPPDGWLAGLESLCRRSDTLLIVDEVFTGFGRTGGLWACEHDVVSPDLVCCGKALGGGLPIAAVLGAPELFAAWSTPGEALHTGTFVAHPLACAAALATLDVLEDEDLVEQTIQRGSRMAPRIATWRRRFAPLVATRGRGLLWGLELASTAAAAELVERARTAGVLLLAGGAEGRVAQIAPPLVITDRQLDGALDVLEDALGHIAPS